MDNRWIVGDPDYCAGKIREAYDVLGGFGTMLLLAQDWDPPEKGWKSMELFARFVAPKIRDLRPNIGLTDQ